MINDETLAMVKPGAWLINVARGRLIDERALLRALGDGPLGGAVLDTFRDEPLPSSSPFYDLENVIVTPHTAWSSGRVLDRSVELFCDNLRRYAAGEPLLNVVDPAAGMRGMDVGMEDYRADRHRARAGGRVEVRSTRSHPAPRRRTDCYRPQRPMREMGR